MPLSNDFFNIFIFQQRALVRYSSFLEVHIEKGSSIKSASFKNFTTTIENDQVVSLVNSGKNNTLHL